jgi:hypothetical protein
MMISIIIKKLLILTMSKVNVDIDSAEGDDHHDFFYVKMLISYNIKQFRH